MSTTQTTAWQKVKLGEIVTERGSVSGPFGSNIHSRFYTKDGVPIIRGNNLTIGINGGRYVDDDYLFLSEKKAEELSQSEALPDDIVITARGTIGQTGIIPHKAKYSKYILSANQLRFRINKEVADPLFVYYWLSSKSMVRTMQNVSVNVGVPNFNLKNARGLLVPLPPLQTQKSIADILSAFDDKIELNNKISRMLEEMAQAIFKEWFIKFRFPGHEKAEFVDSELGKIPKEWEFSNVGAVADNHDSKRIPLSAMERAKRKGGVPYYGANGVLDYVNEAIFSGEYVLFAEDGTVKTEKSTPIIFLVSGDFWVNNHAHIISGNKVSNYFLYLSLHNIPVDQYITGGVQPKITQQNLNSIPVLLPSKSILDKFENIAQPIKEKLRSIENENQKLATMRDLLLPRLISGELTISN